MNEDKTIKKISFFIGIIFVLLVLGIFTYTGVYIKRLQNEIEKYKNAPADTVTIERVDTILVDSPVPVYKYIKEKEYVTITDTLAIAIHDTIRLPREYAVYKDSTYRAVVSGVEPRLDSMAVFPKTKIQYITKTVTKTEYKKTRWGLGVQIGGGIVKDKVRPYLGVGVSYNILTW